MNKITSSSFYIPRPGAVGSPTLPVAGQPAKTPAGGSFQDILASKVAQSRQVRFSAHAMERLSSRQVSLDATEMNKIGQALDCAEAKGARNTLVVGGNYALVCNVPNRVVITAMPRNGMKENVVTNIDSTVFVE